MLYLRVLNKIFHRIYLTGFLIYHGFKICQSSEYIRVLNISGFIKKTLHHIYALQGTDYFSGSAYTRVLNMPGLYKAVCSCHVTYAFQSESTFYSCLNAKELLARSRREI